jgi:ribosome-associated translation inhibitor RaiA
MAFPLDITFKGVSPSAALESWIRRWADRISKLYDRVDHCDVTIEQPHRHQRRGRQFKVDIRMHVPGADIEVTHEPGDDPAHTDPYVAVRDSFRAARRQLEDHLRRLRA